MVDVLISFLIDKLGGILVDQAKRAPPLCKIHARIDRITAEFKVMKAFLESSNWSTTKADEKKPLDAWIEQVRTIALKVEDIIDGYLYLVGEQRERTWKDNLSGPSNLCCNLAKSWHGIDSQLEATEKKIHNLLDMGVGFGLPIIDEDAHDYQVYSPMLNDEKDAWILFCEKAFRRENSRDCPKELENYTSRILNKCQDSPLAIAAIGGLLSFKEKSETEWKKVHDRLLRELGNNSLLDGVNSIITLCFNDLPYYLKNCLAYCSIFPEDYLIKRKKLIRLWIAEGFVKARSTDRLMEEEAEAYLAQLVDRSLLQVVHRNDYGRMKAFRMHDVVREVTQAISGEAKFCMILDDSQPDLDNTTRRLSIQTNDDFLHLNRSLSRLRSLVMFPTSNLSPRSLRAVLISFKMFRVLELEGTPISNLPNEVSTLFNLHYLGLKGTKVEQLPNNIQKLQSLQTLNLRDSRITKLPHGVTQLKQLRHLFASGSEVEFGGTIVACVPTLEEAWQWKNLQTLKFVKANKKLVQLLGNMKELRSLQVVEVEQAHCPQLCTSLTKMRNLRCLRLSARSEEQLNFEMLNSPPPPLQKLDLWGRLFEGKMPIFIYSCAELVRVRLLWSQLIKDPLPSLGQLHKLVVLILGPGAYEGQRLHFRTGGFLNLERLYLGGLKNLNSIEIEEGAMASLHELVMIDLPELKMVHDIQFLTRLQSLPLFGMPKELMGKLRTCQRRPTSI